MRRADDVILDCCVHIQRSPPILLAKHAILSEVVLVSCDANLRIKARAHGVPVCDMVDLRKQWQALKRNKKNNNIESSNASVARASKG